MDDGGFYVVWVENKVGRPDAAVEVENIYGRRFDALGNDVSDAQLINSTTAGVQDSPTVATLTDNSLIVAWTSKAQYTQGQKVVSQRIELDTKVLNIEFDGRPDDSLQIKNWAGDGFIEEFHFDDGTVLTGGELVALYNAGPVSVMPLVDQNATQDALFEWTVPTGAFADSDVDDDLSLSASLLNGDDLPAWLVLDGATGRFSGTPNNSAVGELDVRVTATDNAGASVSDDFTINIANINDAPELLVPLADQDIVEGVAFSFDLPAGAFADSDLGDSVTLTATLFDGSVLPAWLTFDAALGIFSGMPENDAVGQLAIRVIATDAAGASVYDDFQLNIANTNDTPTLVAPLADQSVAEDDLWSFVLPAGTFNDSDLGDSLSFSASLASGAVLPAWLVFDAITASFSGAPGNDAVGLLDVRVTATDTSGESVSDDFQLNITNTNDAPELATPLLDQQANQDQLFNFTLPTSTFSDSDPGDSLTYSASLADGSALPAWLVFDANTGVFSGTPGSSAVGAIDVRVTVSDIAGASTSGDFQLNVVNTDFDLVVVGTAVGEQLLGSSGVDLLQGWAGDDQLYGFAGDDQLEGGAGNDRLQGGNGSNSGSGDDFLMGGSGNDILVGEDGNDRLEGGAGDDHYYYFAGTGQDVLRDDGDGQDILFFNDVATERLSYHQDGDDLMVLVDADLAQQVRVKNHFLGGDSAIMVQPNGGFTQTASNIAAQLSPLPQDDDGTGDDGGTGGDDGDDGDTTNIDPVNIDLSEDNDVLGSGENDVLVTGEGDDTLSGEAGNDVLMGGVGNDLYRIGANSGQDIVVEAGGQNTVRFVDGIVFNDVASGLTKSGDDLILMIGGGANQVRVKGFFSIANTVDIFEFETGGQLTAAQLYGLFGLAAPTATSSPGDVVFGDGQGNSIAGTLNDDIIVAGQGDDTLSGLAGDDQLIGGTGNDTYLIGVSSGSDIVIDTDGSNIVRFIDGVDFNDVASGLMKSGNHLILNIGSNGDQVEVANFFALTNTVEKLEFESGGEISAAQLYGVFGLAAPTESAVTIDVLSTVFTGTGGDDTLVGTSRNDYLSGGAGDDSYQFDIGGGNDTIVDSAGADSLNVGAGLNKEALWFSRAGLDLHIDSLGSDDQMAIQKWYQAEHYQLESIVTALGEVIDNTAVEQLVSAMAAYDMPSNSLADLPAAGQVQIEQLIVDTWQLI